MPDDRPRVVLEKSRTVRRRYQRSNKRLQFTASQIARIEREEERERRAQRLRDKEKRRIADKKKRAEKEAKAREERRRLGLPDPNAPTVPASQPLLFNFMKKTPPVSVKAVSQEEEEADSSGTERTEVASDIDGGSEGSDLDDHELDGAMVALAAGGEVSTNMSVQENRGGDRSGNRDDDEFSDCSIFYDEDVLKEAEAIVSMLDTKKDTSSIPPRLFGGESFQDETAALLDEFGYELDPGASFERELAQLG